MSVAKKSNAHPGYRANRSDRTKGRGACDSLTNRNVFCRFLQIVEQFLLAPRDFRSNVRLGVVERTLTAGRTNASNASEKTIQVGTLLVAATLYARESMRKNMFTKTMRFQYLRLPLCGTASI